MTSLALPYAEDTLILDHFSDATCLAINFRKIIFIPLNVDPKIAIQLKTKKRLIGK